MFLSLQRACSHDVLYWMTRWCELVGAWMHAASHISGFSWIWIQVCLSCIDKRRQESSMQVCGNGLVACTVVACVCPEHP